MILLRHQHSPWRQPGGQDLLLDERRSAPNTKTTTTARTEQTVVRNFKVVMPREEKPGVHSRTRDTTAAPPGRRLEMRHSKQGRRNQDKERQTSQGPTPWYSHTLRPYSKPRDRVQDLRILQLRSRRANIQGPEPQTHKLRHQAPAAIRQAWYLGSLQVASKIMAGRLPGGTYTRDCNADGAGGHQAQHDRAGAII
jgi:hypothetical protein